MRTFDVEQERHKKRDRIIFVAASTLLYLSIVLGAAYLVITLHR
jgi:hypothetical protein